MMLDVSTAWHVAKVDLDINATVIINDIIWQAMKRAQIHAVNEPVDLVPDDGKRPERYNHSAMGQLEESLWRGMSLYLIPSPMRT